MNNGKWFAAGVAVGLGIGLLAFGVYHLIVAAFFIGLGVVGTVIVGRAVGRSGDESSAR